MIVSSITINCKNIVDWDSFHDEFNQIFGFPNFYGRNLNAWIDCMSSIDEPKDGMSKIHCKKDGFITIDLLNAKILKEQRKDIYEAIIESFAFVNYRRIEVGEPPSFILSFDV